MRKHFSYLRISNEKDKAYFYVVSYSENESCNYLQLLTTLCTGSPSPVCVVYCASPVAVSVYKTRPIEGEI